MKNQPSVLVIDDEQIVCDSCHRILENEDFKVESDTNPKAGYQRAISNNYDLILLDLNMSELDGMQLLTRLRKAKPDVPVIIITGYPTRETKEESRKLGVNDYILKPFKPSEILDPVRNIISFRKQTEKGSQQQTEIPTKTIEWKQSDNDFMFYKNSWLQKGSDNQVRVGGLLPILINDSAVSVRTAKVNDLISRGFPVAEIAYPNDVKIYIPSPVTGKVSVINNELLKNPSLFEEDNNNWIATLQPELIEEDMKHCERRSVILLSKDANDSSKYNSQLTKLGYAVSKAANVDEIMKADVKHDVVIFDAKSFGDSGPAMVEKLKERMPDVKIIVFNSTDAGLETQYREKKIFCYAVDPILGREISSILYGAFCFAKDRESLESSRTSFLPQTVRRIHITNRYSKKVCLLSYDNLLLYNKGIGYLLINSLLENAYPIEIDHSRNIYRIKDSMSQQKIAENKQKSDRVIIIHKENLDRIPGSIAKYTETYENNNGAGNQLIRLAIQPADISSDDINFDINTTRAFAKFIESEMTKQ